MVSNSSEIKEILDIASPKTRDAIYILSTSSMLTDSIAQHLLVRAGVANGNAPDVVNEIKSYPIWYTRTQKSWVLDDDVREYALVHLNGNTKQVQKSTLASLRELRGEASNELTFRDQKDLEYQIARLGLKIEEEQQQAVNTFRYFYEMAEQFHVQETSRVVDLYIDESLKPQDQAKGLPEHLQSAYFMQGMFAYRNNNLQKALHLLQIVSNNVGDSYQSMKDGAIAFHLIGHVWAREYRKHNEAEDAYRKSLALGERLNETFHVAQVYHSLGNLLSKDRNRSKEAEDAYRQSLALGERLNQTYHLAQVYANYGKFEITRGNKKKAKELLTESLKYQKEKRFIKMISELLRQLENETK
jgi:tetratricopeptide (TPR) repeat protein